MCNRLQECIIITSSIVSIILLQLMHYGSKVWGHSEVFFCLFFLILFLHFSFTTWITLHWWKSCPGCKWLETEHCIDHVTNCRRTPTMGRRILQCNRGDVCEMRNNFTDAGGVNLSARWGKCDGLWESKVCKAVVAAHRGLFDKGLKEKIICNLVCDLNIFTTNLEADSLN